MCWIGTSGCPGPAAALADQYRWRAGLGNASLSVGLKRLIYSLKYRAKRPGQSRGRQKGGERRGGGVEQQCVRESPLLSGLQSSPCPTLCPALFASYLSFSDCQEQLPRCTEGRRRGGISQSRGDRLQLGIGGEGGVGWEVIGSDGQEVGTVGRRRRRSRKRQRVSERLTRPGRVAFGSVEGAEALVLRSMLGSGGRRGSCEQNTDARARRGDLNVDISGPAQKPCCPRKNLSEDK